MAAIIQMEGIGNHRGLKECIRGDIFR